MSHTLVFSRLTTFTNYVSLLFGKDRHTSCAYTFVLLYAGLMSSHSDLPWYKVFYRAMDKISDLKLDHQNEVVEPFLCGLREHPIPTPGIDTILSVVPKGVDAGQVCGCVCARVCVRMHDYKT